jgi:hypothetical protein
MGFDQYHEPPHELPPATRTFARLCASLTEEAEAIGWYEQRIAIETDPDALAVMRDAQGEEFKHFPLVTRARVGCRKTRKTGLNDSRAPIAQPGYSLPEIPAQRNGPSGMRMVSKTAARGSIPWSPARRHSR